MSGSPEHDPQQKRVYAWEAAHVEPFDKSSLSNAEIRALTESACKLFAVPTPELHFKKTNASCKAFPSQNKIAIAAWGRTKTTVLHEVAHIIDFKYTSGRYGGHGPTFLGFAIFLYSRFLKIETSLLVQSSYGMGLKSVDVSKLVKQKDPDFFEEEF